MSCDLRAVITAMIVDLRSLSSAFEQWKTVEEIAEVLKPKSDNRADFIKECRSGVFDGVVAAYRTFDSISITGRIDEGLIQHFPSSLRFLCHTG